MDIDRIKQTLLVVIAIENRCADGEQMPIHTNENHRGAVRAYKSVLEFIEEIHGEI